MKAVVFHAFGGPDVLRIAELPTPEPGPKQLRVRVVATSVNPVDFKLRQDGRWANLALPAVVGFDVAGVVDAVGAEVTAFSVGDEVLYTPRIFGRQGTYAELHVVDDDIVTRKPKNLGFEEAASLPLAGCTAYDALVLRADLKTDETVLVHAAAGGVGSLAVQIAKAQGARVIATARADNADFVRGLGADHVVDYKKDKVADAVLAATSGKGVDVVLDTVGRDTLAKCIACTRPGGRLVSMVSVVGDLNGAYIKNHTVHFQFLERSEDKIEAIAALAERGALRPVIDSVMPLDEAAKAHEKIERGGVRGKIVLRVGPAPSRA